LGLWASGASAGGPGPSQATLFAELPSGEFNAYNLNDLVADPQGLNLRSANAVCPTGDPVVWFGIAGTGTLIEPVAGGRPDDPHAYVLIQTGVTGIEETTLPGLSPRSLVVDATPNPFTEKTSVSFGLRSSGSTRLSVYDVLGRRVATLAEGFRAAGRYTLSWTGKDDIGDPVSAGVYMVRLESEGGVQTKKVVRVVR
jgi:hypothetical protein